MGSKIENVAVFDSNTVANGLLHDILDVEQMENMLEMELSSEELFRIDCAILSSLRNTQDFSRDLLHQLAVGILAETEVEPPDVMVYPGAEAPQCTVHEEEIVPDITLPIEDMFSQMECFVTEALAKI